MASLFESSEFLFSAVGNYRIELSFDYQDRELAISVDPSQFSNAILNLLINSKDAMDGGQGSVKISVYAFENLKGSGEERAVPDGSYVRIDFSDNGVGMSPEQVEMAFEPFYTTKSEAKGTGVGLSSVRSFLDRSNGDGWISSREGQGTTVSMIFPRHVQNGTTRERSGPDLWIPMKSKDQKA